MINLAYASAGFWSDHYLATHLHYFLFIVPALILVFAAQAMVSSRYQRYRSVSNSRRLSGRDVAERILSANGIAGVDIQQITGHLSDHYAPGKRTLFLSNDVYQGTSIASVAIAAHEVGHALQHAQGYGFLRLRMALVPVCNFGSGIAIPMIVLGITFASDLLFLIGIFAFSLAAFFQLITLPVEFNASRRAMQAIRDGNLLTDSEADGARKMLTAAAMTYVAALTQSALSLLYYISRFSSRRRR